MTIHQIIIIAVSLACLVGLMWFAHWIEAPSNDDDERHEYEGDGR